MEFANAETESNYNGESTKASRKLLPTNLVDVARRKLALLEAAQQLLDLAVPPNNRLEKLTGDREGQYSIRINDQYRICFNSDDKAHAAEVEIVDYH